MARSHLSTKAVEKSTYVIAIAFTDADGTPVVPNSITWTLTDSSGNVVNSRSAVVVSPASSIDVVLSGDDLAIQRPSILGRILTLEWVYDSSYGNNLPGKNEVTFDILPFKNVT